MEQTNSEPTPLFLHRGTRLIAGGFLLAAGVLLSLDNLDVIDSEEILSWWPAVLVLIGALKIAGGQNVAGILLTAVGTSLLAYNMGWVTFTIFDLWPLLLIGAGLAIVVRAAGLAPRRDPAPETSNVISVFADRKVSGPSTLTRASVVAFMAACEIDLTRSEIRGGPAVVDVTAIWAGVVIVVPEGWEIVGEVVPVMGGFEIKTRSASNRDRQLVVRGLALMGGIEIKHGSQS